MTSSATPLWQRDATELLDGFRTGTTAPSAVLAECLDRIERIDPSLNALVAVSASARAEAAASDRRWRVGTPCGPLDGLPIVVKDNLLVAGMPATFGSRVYADVIPDHDELPIRRLRAAGAILLGKTNCPEFALEGYTGNALHGVTRNPFDLELTPGGSSGGSVAAVAAGLVPVAIGTDGGGSLRRPAAYTGLFGLKPGVGTVARSPGLPQLLLDFEVVGPFARSARDLRLVHGVLAGPDAVDPSSRRVAMPRREGTRKTHRILYADRIGTNPCDPAILAACEATATGMAALGHDVERGPLPFDLQDLNALWPQIGQVALAALRRQNDSFQDAASPQYRAMADLGDAVEARELYRLLDMFTALRRAMSQVFERIDCLMTPSCAAMPWVAGEPYPSTIDGQSVGPRGHAVYTAWVNAAHLPAIAIPTGVLHAGVPIGFQLVGDFGSEDSLIDLAESYETRFLAACWPACAL